MESFAHKTLETKPASLTYSYYVSPGFSEQASSGKPTLLLLHGYPDDAQMWAGAVPALQRLGHAMVVVDLLGFGGTAKPTNPQLYHWKQQADSLAQILDAEGVAATGSVVAVGHDWGSQTAQRFYLYHRARCVGLVLVSLAYMIPSAAPFSLEAANRAAAARYGYPQWEYWRFFTAADAPALMEANMGRFYEVLHGVRGAAAEEGEEEAGRDVWMRDMFCTPGAMRAYIARTGRWADYTVPLKPYAADPALRARYEARLRASGMAAPVCYYHALKDGVNEAAEREAFCTDAAGAPADAARTIAVPLLYINQTGDWVCRGEMMDDAVAAGLLRPDLLEKRTVEAGHWVLYEKPAEVAGLIADWLSRKFPASQDT